MRANEPRTVAQLFMFVGHTDLHRLVLKGGLHSAQTYYVKEMCLHSHPLARVQILAMCAPQFWSICKSTSRSLGVFYFFPGQYELMRRLYNMCYLLCKKNIEICLNYKHKRLYALEASSAIACPHRTHSRALFAKQRARRTHA